MWLQIDVSRTSPLPSALEETKYEPRHEISNNVVCGTSKGFRPARAYAQSDQSLCLSLENSMSVKLLTEHHLEFLVLKGGYTGSSESTLVKMPHCWKSHVVAQLWRMWLPHPGICSFEVLPGYSSPSYSNIISLKYPLNKMI